MTSTTLARHPVPAHWNVSDTFRLSPRRELRPGTRVKVQGIGEVRFQRHVSLPDGREWIDGYDRTGAFRAFRPERVQRVLKARAA